MEENKGTGRDFLNITPLLLKLVRIVYYIRIRRPVIGERASASNPDQRTPLYLGCQAGTTSRPTEERRSRAGMPRGEEGIS